MRRLRFFPHAYAFATLLALVRCESQAPNEEDHTAVREYVPGAWSTNFYRPQRMEITGMGLINQETAYFSSRSGVSELHQGTLKRLLQVSDAEIRAFHICHHRSSFFYEVQERDGSAVTIFEHSLEFDYKVKVWYQEDAAPATSLACVGASPALLLRASSSNVIAINVESAEHASDEHAVEPVVSVLLEYESDREDVITSLATGYAADVYTRSQVYALIPHNRTLLRLHLEMDHQTKKVIAESEPVLFGGDGSDGALNSASIYDPLFVLDVHDTVIFADGCALRQIADGRVRTLLGTPTECIAPQNETVEPVPWASRLSKLEALAGAAEETLGSTVLALTGQQVISVVQREDECSSHTDAEECSAVTGCGWAEGEKPHERLCFSCERLHEWAAAQATVIPDPCVLELGPRARTTYSLGGCGCVVPTHEPGSGDGAGLTVLQVLVGGSVIIAAFCCALMYYRASKRAEQMRELYGADTCEFHVFTDADEEGP